MFETVFILKSDQKSGNLAQCPCRHAEACYFCVQYGMKLLVVGPLLAWVYAAAKQVYS